MHVHVQTTWQTVCHSLGLLWRKSSQSNYNIYVILLSTGGNIHVTVGGRNKRTSVAKSNLLWFHASYSTFRSQQNDTKVQRHYFCSYSYSRHGVSIQSLTFVWVGSCVHDVREVDNVLTVRERHVVPWRIICERSRVVTCYLFSPDEFMLMFLFKHWYFPKRNIRHFFTEERPGFVYTHGTKHIKQTFFREKEL